MGSLTIRERERIAYANGDMTSWQQIREAEDAAAPLRSALDDAKADCSRMQDRIDAIAHGIELVVGRLATVRSLTPRRLTAVSGLISRIASEEAADVSHELDLIFGAI